jgi:hypothetical protein
MHFLDALKSTTSGPSIDHFPLGNRVAEIVTCGGHYCLAFLQLSSSFIRFFGAARWTRPPTGVSQIPERAINGNSARHKRSVVQRWDESIVPLCITR